MIYDDIETEILDGKACAESVLHDIAEKCRREKIQPKLVIITDGYDAASKVYIKNKLKAAEECGIKATVVKLDTSQPISLLNDEVELAIQDADGVIVQLPMEPSVPVPLFLNQIPPEKDVDGLLRMSNFDPCTPRGIMRLLKENSVSVEGKHVVIIGRSRLVGKPLARMMLDANATVTVCHSFTEGLATITEMADILVCAVGKPWFISDSTMLKKGAVVVDVGINRRYGKIVGDVDLESVAGRASLITPVPGGVGPMTVAMLMDNTLKAALKNRRMQKWRTKE